jgi:group I intron endonuclease
MKIYCIENILNGKKYIGLTKGTIERRFKRHKEISKSNKKQHLHDAMSLYGVKNFIVYELDSAKDFIELCEKEKFWIKKLNTKKNGYNETDGGEGSFGRILSEETKNKIGNSNRGRIQTEDEKKQRSLSNIGINSGIKNPFYGKTHTKESIKKYLKHKSKCEYCGLESTNANIKRWHNDNCKLK